jgi:hypothetical protein
MDMLPILFVLALIIVGAVAYFVMKPEKKV